MLEEEILVLMTKISDIEINPELKKLGTASGYKDQLNYFNKRSQLI